MLEGNNSGQATYQPVQQQYELCSLSGGCHTEAALFAQRKILVPCSATDSEGCQSFVLKSSGVQA